MKLIIKEILRKFNRQITVYPDFDSRRRMKIIEANNINLLFDVGANDGAYSKMMREFGYEGKIVSFEPLKEAFEKLNIVASLDKNWLTNNYALGDQNINAIINVAGNSYSSSLLDMNPLHLSTAPESEYTRKEEIQIKTLNTVYSKFYSEGDNLMIKIDTQGYEKFVIDGASNLYNDIKVIQLEMSLTTLYENEMLFKDMINYLDNLNYELFSLESGLNDLKTGRLLQVDGIFVNKKFV